MSNKLSIKEINGISRKLRWSLKNTKEAIKEYRNVESIVDHDQLLRTCLNAKNPKDRIDNIAELLTSKLDYRIEYILLKMLDGDHLINVLRVFNVADFVSNKIIKVMVSKSPLTTENHNNWIKRYNSYLKAVKQSTTNDLIEETQYIPPSNIKLKSGIDELSTGSFLKFPKQVTVRPRNFDDFEGLIDRYSLLEKYVDETKLAYDLCDRCLFFKRQSCYAAMDEIKMGEINQLNFIAALDNHHEEINKIRNKSYDEIEELIIKLFPIKHFELLKIPYIESYITRAYEWKFIHERNKFTKKIQKSFLDVDTNRNEITDKQYWFYYCLIEKIKEKGYKTQPASKIAERLLNLTETGSIRSRYYSKKKIVDKDKNFKLDDFIYKQGFTEPINDFLNQVERV